MKVKTNFLKIISDLYTPVGIYLKFRDLYSKIFLLESSDYHGQENSYSYICFNPLATFSFNAGKVQEKLPNGDENHYEVSSQKPLMDSLRAFGNRFDPSPDKFKFNKGLESLAYNPQTDSFICGYERPIKCYEVKFQNDRMESKEVFKDFSLSWKMNDLSAMGYNGSETMFLSHRSKSFIFRKFSPIRILRLHDKGSPFLNHLE